MLAVKLDLRESDVGSVLDVLAHGRPVALACDSSPVNDDAIEVQSRWELEQRLEELFPFRPHMIAVDDRKRVAVRIVLVDGPPISGEGDSLTSAIRDLLQSALDYVNKWERSLRFGAEHQRYWGWVYRLLLAGDDGHIVATLLNEPLE